MSFWKKIQNWANSIFASVFNTSATGRDKELDALADENAEDAYRRQIEFFEQFQSPEAQMKSQLKAYNIAGLNTMGLAGYQPSVTSSSAPMASPASGSGTSPLSAISSMLELLLKKKQTNINKEMADADVSVKEATAEGIRTENAHKDEYWKTLIDKLKSETNLNSANVNKVLADTEYSKLLVQYAPSQFSAQIYELMSRGELNESKIQEVSSIIAKNASEVRLNDAEIKRVESVIKVNNKTVDKMNAEIQKIGAEIQKIGAETNLTEAEIQHVFKNIELADARIKQLGAQIGLTEKEMKWYGAKAVADMFGDVASGVGSAVGGIGGGIGSLLRGIVNPPRTPAGYSVTR